MMNQGNRIASLLLYIAAEVLHFRDELSTTRLNFKGSKFNKCSW